jgi:hypothetical protein
MSKSKEETPAINVLQDLTLLRIGVSRLSILKYKKIKKPIKNFELQ